MTCSAMDDLESNMIIKPKPSVMMPKETYVQRRKIRSLASSLTCMRGSPMRDSPSR